MHPEPLVFVAGRQSEAVAEIHQDGGGLGDHQVPVARNMAAQTAGARGRPFR